MSAIERREFIKLGGKTASLFLLPFPVQTFLVKQTMKNKEQYDAIIIGGSYSGLAVGMAFGRAMKNVLIIDDGKPCNIQTPHSHNFLTNDGKTPSEISATAYQQVSKYNSVTFYSGLATSSNKIQNDFQVTVNNGETFKAKYLIFATGIKDLFPKISGFQECWGISVIHCPYCHGYEVANVKTGILGNGNTVIDFVKLITNWTKDLTLFTNGKATFSSEQYFKLKEHSIDIIENEIESFDQVNGHIQNIIFMDGSKSSIEALYAPSPFEQKCKIPELLGCQLTEEGFLKIDNFFETSIQGVFAVGDNASKMRTVANAVAMGTSLGMMLTKKIIIENFNEISEKK